MPCLIRLVRADENLVALTALIQRAYAPHAAKGLRYWGTHQSAADTATRLASGQGFVAEIEGGGGVMALDTAATAHGLIAMYQRWGYRICGECD